MRTVRIQDFTVVVYRRAFAFLDALARKSSRYAQSFRHKRRLLRIVSTRRAWMPATTSTSPGKGLANRTAACPTSFDEQVRQTLDNVQAVVKSAGLTMEHVVYVQVYLEDMSKYDEMKKAFAEYFGKSQPAQAVLGVARTTRIVRCRSMRSPSAVLRTRKPIYPPNYKSDDSAPPGMLTHDRLFVSSMPGADPATGKIPDDPAAQVDLALDRVEAVVKAAGLELKNMVFVNPYLTTEIPSRVMNEHYARRFEFGNTPARATIRSVESSRWRAYRVHGRRRARSHAAKGGAPEEHAAQSDRQSMCFCRRHFVLLGQGRLYSGAARRRLRHHHAASTAADDAQPTRQPGRSRI